MNSPTYNANVKKQRRAKNRKGNSLMILLKNSLSTSFKTGSMFESLSKRKNITPPRPKNPIAKPKPQAKTGVYSLLGAVV